MKKMMKRLLKRTLLLLTAFLLFAGMTGCSGDAAVGEETGTHPVDSVLEEDTTAETEPVIPLLPTAVPTAEQIENHEKILLWPEDNIPYLIEDDEKGLMPTIRAYLCEGADAAVVIFPGGGYFQLSDESEGVAVAEAYNAEGFSAFVVNYRYEPYDGRATLADGTRAIQYVRYFADTFGIAPDKIAVCGFSAGGHLAVMTAQHPAENIVGDEAGAVRSAPDACILAYPVTTLGDGTYETMPRIFLADNRDNADEIAKYSYPYNLAAMPSTFVFYSDLDTTVDFEKNSIALYKAMTDAGLDAEIKAYTDAPHGVGLGTQYDAFSGWLGESVTFLRAHGY